MFCKCDSILSLLVRIGWCYFPMRSLHLTNNSNDLSFSLFSSSPPTMDSMTKSPSTPPPPLRKKEKPIWKGFIMMQNVAKFVTCAYHVSGPCDNLLQILPDTIHVCGRINHEQVWDYIFQLRGSASKVSSDS